MSWKCPFHVLVTLVLLLSIMPSHAGEKAFTLLNNWLPDGSTTLFGIGGSFV